ncbi:MAG: FAD-binding protein [Nitratireductor sp.]|nr:FAD-binding protein [Nitratireductor sp.]
MPVTARPASEEELADVVRDHAARRAPMRIFGGGTRPVGDVPEIAAAVSACGLSGITLYEPDALTLVAKAGTPLAAIETALAAEGQHLPFEPADHRALLGTDGSSTIGGVAAAGISGPRRIQAGSTRDSLIGLRFVSGEGEIIKNGGRVMKNVTGYDLVKLLCGSHGTLGILTEVSFKLLPKPSTTGMLRIEGLDDATAITALTRALGSPFDVSGAAHAQTRPEGRPLTLIRVEGLPESVAYRTERLREWLAPVLPAGADIAIESDAAKTAAGWQWVRDVEGFAGKPGSVWKLSVKPTDGPGVVADIARAVDCRALYDWGGGLIWLLTPAPDAEAAPVIRGAVNARGGHATLMRRGAASDPAVPAFHPEAARIAALSQALRRKFDPAGILNPGLMGR